MNDKQLKESFDNLSTDNKLKALFRMHLAEMYYSGGDDVINAIQEVS